MQNVMSLGECLFTIVAFCIVSYGIWRAQTKPRPNMSSESEVPNEVVDTVPGTDTKPEVAIADLPDTSAVPATRHMSVVDIIVLLASQKKANGDWRFSANSIYVLVKGNRADVLGMVQELRDGKTEYVSDMISRVQKEVQNNASK